MAVKKYNVIMYLPETETEPMEGELIMYFTGDHDVMKIVAVMNAAVTVPYDGGTAIECRFEAIIDDAGLAALKRIPTIQAVLALET